MNMYRKLQPAGRYHDGATSTQSTLHKENACVHTITNTTRGACYCYCYCCYYLQLFSMIASVAHDPKLRAKQPPMAGCISRAQPSGQAQPKQPPMAGSRLSAIIADIVQGEQPWARTAWTRSPCSIIHYAKTLALISQIQRFPDVCVSMSRIVAANG